MFVEVESIVVVGELRNVLLANEEEEEEIVLGNSV